MVRSFNRPAVDGAAGVSMFKAWQRDRRRARRAGVRTGRVAGPSVHDAQPDGRHARLVTRPPSPSSGRRLCEHSRVNTREAADPDGADDRPAGPDGESEPAPATGAAGGWAPASFPVEPAETVDAVLDIAGATLSGFAIGRLRTIEPPSRWTRGAVYDAAGMLVEASQRIGGTARDVVVAADPKRLRPTPSGWLRRVPGARRFRGRRLNGTWLYAGTWMHQFGHFVTETVTTLWPDPIDVAGLVAHPFAHQETRYPWQADLVELAGYGARPLVLALEPVRVERLLVPTRPFVAAAYATPMAVRAWERIAEAATGAAATPDPSGNVFLSRSRFHRRAGDASRLDTDRRSGPSRAIGAGPRRDERVGPAPGGLRPERHTGAGDRRHPVRGTPGPQPAGDRRRPWPTHGVCAAPGRRATARAGRAGAVPG